MYVFTHVSFSLLFSQKSQKRHMCKTDTCVNSCPQTTLKFRCGGLSRNEKLASVYTCMFLYMYLFWCFLGGFKHVYMFKSPPCTRFFSYLPGGSTTPPTPAPLPIFRTYPHRHPFQHQHDLICQCGRGDVSWARTRGCFPGMSLQGLSAPGVRRFVRFSVCPSSTRVFPGQGRGDVAWAMARRRSPGNGYASHVMRPPSEYRWRYLTHEEIRNPIYHETSNFDIRLVGLWNSQIKAAVGEWILENLSWRRKRKFSIGQESRRSICHHTFSRHIDTSTFLFAFDACVAYILLTSIRRRRVGPEKTRGPIYTCVCV